MHKKIEDAAKEYIIKHWPEKVIYNDDNYLIIKKMYKAGAEWAFNECIKIIDRTVKTPEELGTIKLVIGALLVKDEIKYLYLSSEASDVEEKEK